MPWNLQDSENGRPGKRERDTRDERRETRQQRLRGCCLFVFVCSVGVRAARRGATMSFVWVTGQNPALCSALVASKQWTGCHAKDKVLPWQIKTKYFEAVTHIRVLDLEELKRQAKEEGEGEGEGSNPSSVRLDPPQALVAVFDINDERTFVEAREALESTTLNESWFKGVEVRLLVATGATEAASLQAFEEQNESDGREEGKGETHWVAKAYDWCRDHCFEYVEANTEDEDLDTRLRLYEDPQGVKRIVEALECHRWPGSQMNMEALGEGGGEIKGVHEEEEDEEQEQGSAAPFPVEVETQSKQEEDMENFENLLAKLSSVRETSKQLPDDQRRELAEKMLLSIMDELGIQE